MGIAPEIIIKYRYPGTKFFESHQHNIFFGRLQETGELIHSIKAHDVFVIFADSGIGKTSLLNAGLIPELEKENIQPVHFRFQDTAIPPLKTIAKKLGEYCSQPELLTIEAQQKLWRLFKCCDFKNKTPLFVLDQFEEFFNHQKNDKEECVNELADLINDYLPDYIRDEMREKFKEKDPTAQELKYYTPARVKMLFLIRADKLKLLDDLSKKIPLILRNRFHLKPLNTEQAEQAILLPALLPQNGFASPTFTFQPEAVKAIGDYLKNEEDEVESFQLQLLCQELEKKIIQRYEKEKNALVITEEELGGKAGMDNITKNYYSNQINSIPDEILRKKAVILIEDKLIVEERRISLPEVLLLSESEGYTKELLDYLLNTTRLIRVDNDRYVEISHDRLLSAILKSKEQREKEEGKLKELQKLEKLEEEKTEKNRLLNKERKIKQRYFFFSIVVTILLIASVYFFLHMMKSDSEAKVANVKYLISKQDFGEADAVLKANNLFSSINFYNKDILKHLRDSVEKEKVIQDKYFEYSNSGDSLRLPASLLLTMVDSLLKIADPIAEQHIGKTAYFETVGNELIRKLNGERLLLARAYYVKALETGYIPNDAGFKLADIDSKISYLFKLCIDAAYVFLKVKDRQRATEAFKKGETLYSFAHDSTHIIELSPDDTPYLDSLKKILKQ